MPSDWWMAKRQGYRLMNESGEALFCRDDPKIRSRIRRNPTCLTADQLDELHDQTRQALGTNIKPIAPPQGH